MFTVQWKIVGVSGLDSWSNLMLTWKWRRVTVCWYRLSREVWSADPETSTGCSLGNVSFTSGRVWLQLRRLQQEAPATRHGEARGGEHTRAPDTDGSCKCEDEPGVWAEAIRTARWVLRVPGEKGGEGNCRTASAVCQKPSGTVSKAANTSSG